MRVLLDTNILLRIAQVNSQHHVIAKSAVIALANADVELCIVPQIVYEFWSVATRPIAVNGLGMDVSLADHSVQELLTEFVLLRDERGIFGNWHALVVNHAVQGKTTHDARLVAAMQRHGLLHLLTFNDADFRRFSGIDVLAPADIVAGRLPAR